MSYDVRLEQAASIPLAVVKRQAKQQELSKVVPAACGLVWNVIRAQQLRGGRHVSIYWDCSQNVMNVEVGVEMDAPFQDEGEVVHSATPAGTVITTTHLGPYQLLGNANQAIQQFAAANGHQLAGPSWEIYGHWMEEWNQDPAKIRTDVFYLVKK